MDREGREVVGKWWNWVKIGLSKSNNTTVFVRIDQAVQLDGATKRFVGQWLLWTLFVGEGKKRVQKK